MSPKIMTVVGTRPEIIRLSRVMAALDRHVDHVLIHTGQNYDYELNQIFFDDLEIRRPDVFLDAAGLDPGKKANQVSVSERRIISSMLKGWRLDIAGPRPIEEAMVTRGGVSLKEVNPKTMESHLIKSLYFCGEMLDIDADTGGFNLQAAFSTGYLAGENAAKGMSNA